MAHGDLGAITGCVWRNGRAIVHGATPYLGIVAAYRLTLRDRVRRTRGNGARALRFTRHPQLCSVEEAMFQKRLLENADITKPAHREVIALRLRMATSA